MYVLMSISLSFSLSLYIYIEREMHIIPGYSNVIVMSIRRQVLSQRHMINNDIGSSG